MPNENRGKLRCSPPIFRYHCTEQNAWAINTNDAEWRDDDDDAPPEESCRRMEPHWEMPRIARSFCWKPGQNEMSSCNLNFTCMKNAAHLLNARDVPVEAVRRGEERPKGTKKEDEDWKLLTSEWMLLTHTRGNPRSAPLTCLFVWILPELLLNMLFWLPWQITVNGYCILREKYVQTSLTEFVIFCKTK